MINNLLRPVTPTISGTIHSEEHQLQAQPVLVKAYVPPADDISYSESAEHQPQYQLPPQAFCVDSITCSSQDSNSSGYYHSTINSVQQPTVLCSSNTDSFSNCHVSLAQQQPTTAATTVFSSCNSSSIFSSSSSSNTIPVTVASASAVQQYQAIHFATIPASVFGDCSNSRQTLSLTSSTTSKATTATFTTARGSRSTSTGTTSTTVRLAMPEQTHDSELLAAEGEVEAENIHLQLDAQDEKIMAATLKAFESGSLTPLIKEELRCTIQSRRLAAGKGELQVEFKRPAKRKEMTDEERKRALKRRQQNREAAQRFRQRQKDTTDYLSGKIKRLEKASNTLLTDLKRLKEERDELKKMLEDHLIVCPNHGHTPVTVDPSVEQFLRELTTPSTSSTPQFSLTTPECPDTADSGASVFFSDDGSDISHTEHTLGSLVAELNNGLPEEMLFSHGGNDADAESASAGAPEVCYEEVVVEMDFADSVSEYSDDQRLDSCSSVDTASNYGSVSSDLTSLSESTTDLRHSLASAYSRVHMNSCSSQPFETSYIVADFLLPDDEECP